MWNKVQTARDYPDDIQNDTLPGGVVADPAGGEPNEHPGGGVNICEGENWTVDT